MLEGSLKFWLWLACLCPFIHNFLEKVLGWLWGRDRLAVGGFCGYAVPEILFKGRDEILEFWELVPQVYESVADEPLYFLRPH
jgi:hypothetical protein